MAETQKDMDETEKEVDGGQKDRDETEKDMVVTEKDMVVTEKDMVVTEKDMVVTEKDMVVTEKDINWVQKDRDEDQRDMDEEPRNMEDGQKDIDEGIKDMDDEQKEMDEGIKDMDDEQKEMDEGTKDMDDEQIDGMNGGIKDMDEGVKDTDEEQKDMCEVEKTLGDSQNVMDEGQKDMEEQQKTMSEGQTSVSVVSEEDSPSQGQQVEEVDGGAPENLTETQQKQGQGRGTLEQLRQRQQEDQEEMEEMNRRREEKRRAREEEEELQKEEEKQQRQKQVEEETRRVNEGIDKRRTSAERRLKNLSISSNDGDESISHFSPMSPTFKNEVEERMTTESACTLNERTESLNRSLQKSNSMKKSESPVPISKIDNRLEQYTHAIEEAKVAKQQGPTDLPSPSEPLASKKSLFEAGDAWTPKGTPSKDTEGLKVGVADLIHQWVKGNPDGSCKGSSPMPAEVKAGDVLSKKNLWENVGDSSSPGKAGKGAGGKKYKFVMMAHGKYEKVLVGDDGRVLPLAWRRCAFPSPTAALLHQPMPFCPVNPGMYEPYLSHTNVRHSIHNPTQTTHCKTKTLAAL
ncbi:hypothetical protein DPEC_G00250660 [Dallia pectoralis]|uniref:Uncharacterized protein n=1 Tax=Dallia pectoralis TaxID=75939 RepID=A0ACC2FSY2_DALPE|nr:hypothetical protein DPEC_G00250660 [Dallia pectoralis]